MHGPALTRRTLLQDLVALMLFGHCRLTSAQPSSGVVRAIGFNHVTFAVSDLEQSGAFYERLFGFSRAPALELSTAQRVYTIGARGAFISLQLTRTRPAIEHVCLSVDRFDRERIERELRTIGVGVEDQPGPDWIYFHDPIGVRLQLQASPVLASTAAPTALLNRQQRLATVVGFNHVTVYASDWLQLVHSTNASWASGRDRRVRPRSISSSMNGRSISLLPIGRARVHQESIMFASP